MKVANFNNCKVYNLSSGKSFPQWLSESKKRALANDEEYRRRLELIQDFEMNTTAQCIRMTADNEHIVVAGTYPPCVRCYTVSDLALKFHRGLTCEVVAMESLSPGYEKLVFLQADRNLSFHAPYGTHYSVRIPKFGRHMIYNWGNCDLYISSVSDEIYRMNLEAGQFKEPFKLSFEGCNAMHTNPVHQLLAAGGERGICEFWDTRYRKCASTLLVPNMADGPASSFEITALKFDSDGLTLGVGTSNGNVLIYDIRSSKPIYTKEHQYGEKIIDVHFHNSTKHIISTDKKIIKIWDREASSMGQILTNIETTADINNIIFIKDQRGDTGMLMAAGEQSKIMTYFVPQLGPAPRWCSFLESLTEELEENTNTTVYEDYKFLTKNELEELGATGLIGTPMVKSYMHGFFMDMKLYNKLRAVSKPFEYEEHRKKLIQQKIEMKRESRIAPRKRVKVGKKSNDSDDDEMIIGSKGSRSKGKEKESGLDPRFAMKLEREEFQIDETSEAYRLKHGLREREIQQKILNQSKNSYGNISQELGLRKQLMDNDSDDENLLVSSKGLETHKSMITSFKGSNQSRKRESDRSIDMKEDIEGDNDGYESVEMNDSEDEQLLKSSKHIANKAKKSKNNSRMTGKTAVHGDKRMRSKNIPQMYES